MPRPRQHHGRPNATVIPTTWEAENAKVVTKTLTATVTIYPPVAPGAVTVNADLSLGASTPTPIVAGTPARLQALNAQESRALVGDQQVVMAGYLVAIDRELEIPLHAVVKVDTCSDTDFVGRRLRVYRFDHGSIRWERDLYCVEDLTAPTS